MKHAKIQKALEFLRLASGRKMMTIYEMAEIQGVSTKTILRYLADLRAVGIEIQTTTGPHGLRKHRIPYKSIHDYLLRK